MCVGCLIGELPMKNVNTSMQILFFLNNFRNFLYCSPKVSITLFKFCKRLLCLQFYGFVFISVYADVLFISRTAQRVCVPVVPESPTAALGRPKRKQTVSKRKKSNMYHSTAVYYVNSRWRHPSRLLVGRGGKSARWRTLFYVFLYF